MFDETHVILLLSGQWAYWMYMGWFIFQKAVKEQKAVNSLLLFVAQSQWAGNFLVSSAARLPHLQSSSTELYWATL